jgi:hypothetical protein
MPRSGISGPFLICLLTIIDRDLISLISDEDAQALVGGHGVTVPGQASFVNNWHHLGRNHVNPSPNGNDQIDAFNGDPTAVLHNFKAAAGKSGRTPTE